MSTDEQVPRIMAHIPLLCELYRTITENEASLREGKNVYS
jgi:hypothetical protein